MRRILIVALSIFALSVFDGCSKVKTFRFSFANRVADEITMKVDGERLGEISPGETRQFEHEVRILESSPTGPGTTDEAEVTVTAENRRTGKVTRGMRIRIYRDRVNHLDINSGDFLP